MRDVNQSGFFLIADDADLPYRNGALWDPVCRVLTLDRRQADLLPARDAAASRAARAVTVPLIRDSVGRLGRLTEDGLGVEVLVGGAWEKVLDREGNAIAPRTGRFVAMTLGAGTRLVLIATDGAAVWLQLFDLKGRWPLDSIANPSLPVEADPAATDVAVSPDGTILVAGRNAVLVVDGGPAVGAFERLGKRFEPLDQNPHPIRQRQILPALPGTAVALAADNARVVRLVEDADGGQTLSIFNQITGLRTDSPLPPTLPVFNDVACLDERLVALIAPADPAFLRRDVAVGVPLPGGFALTGERYPRTGPGTARFVDSADGTTWYPAPDRPRPLVPLPHPDYVVAGAALRMGIQTLDADTIWHRAYCEADMPAGTSLTLWARAASDPLLPGPGLPIADVKPVTDHLLDRLTAATTTGSTLFDGSAIDPDVFDSDPRLKQLAGEVRSALMAAPLHRQPPLVPSGLPSELPFHPGLAALANEPGTHFDVLLQRSVGKNRRLQGQFGDIAFVLTGDGRHTPLLRACRVYTPRFSYQERYLPRLFQQTVPSDETDRDSRALPADFRERFLGAFEAVLTPIEGRIAAAEMLLQPGAAPTAALPWLASFLGRDLDPSWPEARQRRSVAVAGQLLQQRGTYRGVCLALDVATDFGVQRGEVVVVENFRLRRSMATILGILMDDTANPLTLNARVSGNSIVGDTLILAEDVATEFLALFAPDIGIIGQRAAVQRFLDHYADRVTVLLHGKARAFEALVRQALTQEMPANVGWDVFPTDHSFVLGLGPLLGIDTFLDPPDPAMPVTLDVSVLTRDAVIHDPGTLAPGEPGGQ